MGVGGRWHLQWGWEGQVTIKGFGKRMERGQLDEQLEVT